MNGAQVLAAGLAADIGGPVFGLLGDGNLILVDEMVAVHSTRFVATRHEHAAVCAAMGWAHATGGIGVATTTHGPGLAQTTSALITAVKACASVLLVTGATHPAARLHAQRTDQRALVLACGAAHVVVRSPATILDDLAVAVRLLAEGPVVLDVDLSVLEAETLGTGTAQVRRIALPTRAPAPAPDPEAVDRAAAILAGARRPLMLLGRGAVGAVAAVETLADRLAAEIGTTLLGQGLLPDHPRQLGVVGGFSSPATRRRLASVDAVLAVGASLTRFTVDNGRLFAGVPIVQIDRDARAVGDPVPVEVALVADGQAAVQAIAAALATGAANGHVAAGSGDGQWADGTAVPPPHVGADRVSRLSEGRSADAEGIASGSGDDDEHRVRDDPDGDDPRDVLDAVDAAVPADRGLVVGVGGYSGWGALHVGVVDTAARLLPWDFGAVGIALGAGIGMAVAHPDRPTVVIEGDGGVMMTLPEFDTLAREGLPVLVVVLDDRGFGAEAHILRREGRSTDRAWIPTPDLVTAARGLGLRAATARGEGIAPAVTELLADLPALLHVPTSRRAVHHEIFAALSA